MSQLYIRAYPATLERTDQRQLTGRLVPYGVVADVLDEMPDGRFDIYREGFRPGAFGPQVSLTAGRLAKIGLVHTHEGGLGYLGPFVGLREEADGLYGDVRVLPSKAPDVDALLEAGINELSVEFRLRGSDNTDVDGEGVRWRTRAHLDRVALEPKGAYSSAQVLAFRAEVEEHQREEAAAAAKAEAEAQQEAERDAAAVAALAEEQRRLDAEATAALERRRRFDELAARLPAAQARQEELLRQHYGTTARRGGPR